MEHKETIKESILEELYQKIQFTEEEELILLQQIIELKKLYAMHQDDTSIKENIELLQKYMNS